MTKLFKINLLFIILGLSLSAFGQVNVGEPISFSDAADDAWSENMVSTQNAVAQQQQEAAAAREQAQLQQQKQTQALIEGTLKNMQSQKQQAEQQAQQTNGPISQPKPLPQTGTKNPWLKQNPWSDSAKNPYKGQQYSPNPQAGQTQQQQAPNIYAPGASTTSQPNQSGKSDKSKPDNIFQ